MSQNTDETLLRNRVDTLEKGPTLNSQVVPSPQRSRGETVKGLETKNEDKQKRLRTQTAIQQ